MTKSSSFVRIPSLNFPKMRPSDTFKSVLSNGYHGNNDPYKNFDVSFRYIFSSSMAVQSSIAIE